VKTIIKILKNFPLIIEGLRNFLFKKDPIEVIARKRLYTCMSCTSIDKKGTSCVVNGTQPCCAVCGCSLALKLRSMESECPHPDGPKWKEEVL